MLTFRSLIAAALGLSFLTFAMISDADPPPPDTGTGMNGMKPDNFRDYKIKLWDATAARVVGQIPVNDLKTTYVSPANNPLLAPLLTTPEGRDTFRHAASCVLPKNTRAVYVDPSNITHQFPGGGYLKSTSTSSWFLNPLPLEERLALFECMLTLLNGVGSHVRIELIGQNVASSGEDMSGYTVREAIWMAKNTTGGLMLSVYPKDVAHAQCKVSSGQSFNKRICGTPNGGCGIKVLTSAEFNAAGCTESSSKPGVWSCGGVPAIETRLNPKTAVDLYPDCQFK